MFVGLHSGKIKHFYILLGVLDHYTLLKVTLDQIVFYDSINTSLSDIVNGTNLQPPVTKDA